MSILARLKKTPSKYTDRYNKASEKELVDFVNKEFDRRQKERRIFELQWRLNIAFIEGQQYMEINTARIDLDQVPKLYEWQEREVFNEIAPILETRLAKLARMRPILQARPGSNAQEDIRSSKVGTMVLKFTYGDQRMKNKMNQINAWSEACGSGFLKNIWNPNIGKVVAIMQSPAAEGEEAANEEIREGDIEAIVVPPQEIFPDSSYHEDIEDCKSIIHAKAYSIKDIKDIWGVDVSPEDITVMKLQRSMTGVGGLGYGMWGYRYASTELKDYALVKEFSERPTKDYPEGRLILVAGGKLLDSGPLPYPIGKDGEPDLNFRKVDCIKRPGCFWGRTVVERLIPIQRRYNALRNRKAEYLNRVAIGQWVVEENSLVDGDDSFEAQAGAPGAVYIKRKGSESPHQIDTPELPAAFQTEEAGLLQEFSRLSGVSELSRQSQAPPGVKSGVALSIALEQDDTRLSSTAANIEDFLVECGKIWLRLYKHYAKGPRTVRDIGKDNIVEIMDWTGADIRSDDVAVEGASAFIESPAQKRQMVFDLLQQGLFNDPETGRITKEGQVKIFEMLEFGNWESGDDDTEIHISKAERENRALMEGGQAKAVSYEDHMIHIQRHNRFRLTTDYEELMMQNPLIDMLFQQHVNIHLDFLQSQVMSKVAAMGPQEAGQPQPQGV